VAEIIRFKGQVAPPLNQVTFQLFLFPVHQRKFTEIESKAASEEGKNQYVLIQYCGKIN